MVTPECNWNEIGRGGEGVVEVDLQSMVVRKRYENRDPALMADLASREYDYLERFSRSIVDEPYLSCPHPIAVAPDHGTVLMSFCSGVRLDVALADASSGIESHLDHIAEQILAGVDAYVAEFNEPFHTIRTHNMLYDRDTRVLSFVDLYGVNRFPDRGLEQALFEVSLARLVGGAIFRSVRPKTSIHKAYWDGHRRLINAVVSRMSTRKKASLTLIHEASENLYTHAYQNWQPRSYAALRQLWYRTAGKALFLRRAREVIVA